MLRPESDKEEVGRCRLVAVVVIGGFDGGVGGGWSRAAVGEPACGVAMVDGKRCTWRSLILDQLIEVSNISDVDQDLVMRWSDARSLDS